MQRKARGVPWGGILVGGLLLLGGAMAWGAGKSPETSGAPDSTVTLDTRILPPSPPQFGGKIGMDPSRSKAWWPPQVVPAAGAPNVLLILTDDVGFGAPSTFGGVIPTPTLDRIAQTGLRYTAFHSTALCSPTRAALLTGRNHHAVHAGVVTEIATGFPGYDSMIGRDSVTIGEILRQNGYSTAWFGKDHNTPDWMTSQSGPFDQWPVGYGFDYFFGFIGGDTSQWTPNLFRNTSPIEPYLGKPGWNLTTAMADDAIAWVQRMNAIDPAKPFFIHYAPGGTHAPHHPTPEWVAAFHGQFDAGWNVLRQQIFENQRKLGVIPANSVLPPWPDSLPKWETVSLENQKLFARQAEVYAAYLAYTDSEIGRVVQAISDLGRLDDTLVIYVSGDNGASPEGGMFGTPNEIASLNGIEIPPEEQTKLLPAWGTDRTYPHMAAAWSWVFDTPYRWTKQIASHFGGTRQGMVMSWPKRIKPAGGIRPQFHHVIDVVPTILEAARIPAPMSVNGIRQKPIDGVSMAYTWEERNARASSRRETQYFEMVGNRAIYHKGWIASTTPPIEPWRMREASAAATPRPPEEYAWELYDLEADPTQSKNLAAKYPGQLADMQHLFLSEARKNGVLPLDNRLQERVLTARPGPAFGRSVFHYTAPVSRIPHGAAPNILGRSFRITVELEVPPPGAEGMLVTQGGRFGGYGFYLLRGRPVFVYNLLGGERFRWESPGPLSPGKHRLLFAFQPDGAAPGAGGKGTLRVDGAEVAVHPMANTPPFLLQWDEGFDVGSDSATPVEDSDYRVPFAFTGTLIDVKFELGARPGRKDEDGGMAGRARPGEAWIPRGRFQMGCFGTPEMTDCNPVHEVELDGFWMDRTPVTRAQYERFVEATGYVTVAERPLRPGDFPEEARRGLTPEDLKPGSSVFSPPVHAVSLSDASAWWRFVRGASWREPAGHGGGEAVNPYHPVVHVAWADADAYCRWAGKRLPTEAEFEFAARGGLAGKRYAWGDTYRPGGRWMANTFQGNFPVADSAADGHRGTSPVGRYPANGYGLFDMTGNVWQWTSDWYDPDYYRTLENAGKVAKNPQGPSDSNDPAEPGVSKKVQRGGSFLCASGTCQRYLVGSRGRGAVDSGASHTGFRCVRDGPGAFEKTRIQSP